MTKNFTVRSWTGKTFDDVQFTSFNKVDEADNFARKLRDSGSAKLVTVFCERLGEVIGDFSAKG